MIVLRVFCQENGIMSQHVNSLKQWFLTGEESVNFQGGASPDAPYNMESLINEFTNKYICF